MEPKYTAVGRSREEIAIAVLRAAIDDIGHTSNMNERTNHELGLETSMGDETDYQYVTDIAMIEACQWAISFIAQSAGWKS